MSTEHLDLEDAQQQLAAEKISEHKYCYCMSVLHRVEFCAITGVTSWLWGIGLAPPLSFGLIVCCRLVPSILPRT